MRIPLLLGAGILLLLPGCGSTATFFPGRARAEVWEAAREVMRDQQQAFYEKWNAQEGVTRVKRDLGYFVEDPARGHLRAEGVKSLMERWFGRCGDLAEVWVTEDAHGTWVRCHYAFQREREAGPAFCRGACFWCFPGLPWAHIRRDRDKENLILEEIRGALEKPGGLPSDSK